MRWIAAVALACVVVLSFCLPPHPSRAGAFDQLQSMAGGSGYVPAASNPSPVYSSGSTDSSSSSSTNSGFFSWFAPKEPNYAKALESNEKGHVAYRSGNYREAVRLYREALRNSPNDQVIKQNLENAKNLLEKAKKEERENRERKSRRAKAERKRRQEAEKAERQRRRNEKKAEQKRLFDDKKAVRQNARESKKDRKGTQSPSAVKGKVSGSPSAAGSKPSPGADAKTSVSAAAIEAVSPGSEWKTLRELDFRAESLRRKVRLTESERSELAEIGKSSLKIWAAGAANERLTSQERNRLHISIPIAVQEGTAATADRISGWRRAVLEATDPVGVHLLGKARQGLESARDSSVEKTLSGMGLASAGKLVGAAKIAVKIDPRDLSRAGKETLDVLIGMLPMPQAAGAVEGGRIYSKVAFDAMDDFMKKAMKTAGSDFDTKEFWKKFRDELSTGQKTVFDFIGGKDGR